MREILFRGKRAENDEWVFGDLRHIFYGECYPHIVDNSNGLNNSVCGLEVDPATVGQFTGLTDRNGVKIFEGDIIKWHDNTELSIGGQIAEICYGKYIDADSHFDDVYLLGFYFKLFDKDKTCATISWLDEYKNDFDIIGNIYDNPELLVEVN